MTNVRIFGAVGDGRTDATAPLRHAADQGGVWLHLTRGTYRLTTPLETDLHRSGPIALNGQGGTARLLVDGPGPAIRLLGTHGKSADPSTFSWSNTVGTSSSARTPSTTIRITQAPGSTASASSA